MANLNDDDTCVFIPPEIKLTPFDRRRQELRALQEKYDGLSKQPNKERQLAELDYLIRRAKERFAEENKRGVDDGWRRRREVDRWRSGEGKELRNSSRRKVRDKPNEDLSHMTDEQKEERKRDQRADANFIARQTAKGVSETEIQAGLVLRRQQRARERETAVGSDSAMTRNPTLGMF